MAQITYRANIQSSIFPLLSELMGDDVIVQRIDQTYVPDMNPSPRVAPVDKAVAQVIYAHNVMPSTYGYQSVGFEQYYAPYGGDPVYFDEAYLVVSEEAIRTYVAVDRRSDAKRLYTLTSDGDWIKPIGTPVLKADTVVSVATVNGLTYVACSNIGVYSYSTVSKRFKQITLNGIENKSIRGIIQANGYLIVWSDTGVAWSAVDDPLDFEPSDISGAGAGDLQEAKGKITHCAATSYGFIVYTENNAVSVTWSGNTDYPFNFKSIPGAGGIASGSLVTAETVNAQYAYTTNGMQQIYHTGAKTVLSYVTDFIAGQVFEDFDEETDTLQVTTFEHTMRKKLTLVNDRYLVLSYGINPDAPFTHAIIIDLAQTRTGKVKIDHTHVFELRNLSPEVIETPRQSVAFLGANGAVNVLDFNIRNTNAHGVLILGRYRVTRDNLTTLQSVTFENVMDNADFTVQAYAHLESKRLHNPLPLVRNTAVPQSYVRKYYGEVTGDSVSLLCKGSFNIMTAVLGFTLNGIL